MATMEEELAKAQRELGISGDDIAAMEEIGAFDVGDFDIEGDDEIGAKVKRVLKKAAQKMRSQQVRITPRSGIGPLSTVIIPGNAYLSLAFGVAGNLVFTAQDKVEIMDLILDVNVAAAAAAAIMPAAIAITAITVGTHNVLKGAGQMPITPFLPTSVQRRKPFLQWGALDNGQSLTLGLLNNDAATTHVISGALICIGAM